jgi:prefoldin subunit 5
MKDIQQVLRQKRAQLERLTREIDLLQQAEQTLREVAPLLADSDEEDAAVLTEIGEDTQASAAAAGVGSQKSVTPASPVRTTVPRWP